MAVSEGMTEKLLDVWQDVQLAPVATGIWLPGFCTPAGSNEMPMWHCEHSPVVGWEALTTLNGPAAACGRVWKPV